MSPPLLLLSVLLAQRVSATLSSTHDPTGTEQFVTRPEIKAPRYMTSKHHPESIAEGYWFVSPYSDLGTREVTDRNEYVPCHTGPHIYDGNGTLVWSGACEFDNRNVFNFRPVDINGEQHLSFWLEALSGGNGILDTERKAYGVILNNRYEEVHRSYSHDGKALDGHEYTIQPDGRTVLYSTIRWIKQEASEIDQASRDIIDTGFRWMDMETGKPLFEWDPLFHGLQLNESCDVTNMMVPQQSSPWDWFHINSIERDLDGDYLVSARHTSTIYKISGKTGAVIWRLGGCYDGVGDFVMQEGVHFQWQHHARWRFQNATHSIISLFDNGAESFDLNPNIAKTTASAKVILLDTASRPMTAKLLRRLDRPDGKDSHFLGSVQPVTRGGIEQASIFVNWADRGYISEFDSENRLVLEARFESTRQRVYRAYKYPFVGRPRDLPTFKMVPLGPSNDAIYAGLYVSWNGATEVHSWTFWVGDTPTDNFKRLTTVLKRGFETSFISAEVPRYAYVVAIDAQGNELARSGVSSILPSVNGNFTANCVLCDSQTAFSTQERPDNRHAPEVGLGFLPQSLVGTHGKAVAGSERYIVGGLAGFGAFCIARNLLHRFMVWRKGYRELKLFPQMLE